MSSCGKKGDPLPPLRPVPAAPEGLTLRQIGDRLRLQWKAPARNEDGTTEGVNLREAVVLRRVLDLAALAAAQALAAETLAAESPTAETPTTETPTTATPTTATPTAETPTTEAQVEPGRDPAALEPDAAAAGEAEAPPRPTLAIPPFPTEAVVVGTVPSTVLGEALEHEEPVDPSWIGKRVEYAVRYVNRKDRESAFSEILAIEPAALLEPARDLRAEAGDGRVALSWSPPPADGGGVAFSVFRRVEGAEAMPDSPLNSEPLAAPRFEDRSVVFGAPACYVVVAARAPSPPPAPPQSPETAPTEPPEEAEPRDSSLPVVPAIANPWRVESVPSEEVCITPVDRFPPAVPEGLVAVASPDGILLSWSEVEAQDLRAYRVYRAESPSGPFVLLVESRAPSYTDAGVPPGVAHFYTVTAIDDAEGINESARSEPVGATRPP